MPVTAIELENFKGVRERQRIELTPITLLFGPNSSGKSSIIHALHYAREIFLRGNLDAREPEAGVRAVDLGGFRALVHGQGVNNRVELRTEMSLAGEDYDPFDFGAAPGEVFSEDLESGWVEVSLGWSSALERPLVMSYDIGLNGQLLARTTATEEGKVYLGFFDTSHPALVRGFGAEIRSSEVIQSELPFVHDPDEAAQAEFEFPEDEEPAARGPMLRGATALDGQHGALPIWGEPLDIPTPEDDDEEAESATIRRVLGAISLVIVGTGEILRRELRRFRYLGPLRCIPPRSFDPAPFDEFSRWADGSASWDALSRDAGELAREASEWLGSEHLNTGYGIRRRTVWELDQASALVRSLLSGRVFDDWEPSDIHGELNKLPTRTRLCLTMEGDEPGEELEVQPHDIGVGISQLLPVVVSALQKESGLVAIEQPELHLHPAIQVGLGDLFAARVRDSSATFLIETHSEHLLLRLLRRIRESSESTRPLEGALTPEDVAVYYLEKSEDGAVQVTPIRISEDGDFLDRWPRGFFPERRHELM